MDQQQTLLSEPTTARGRVLAEEIAADVRSVGIFRLTAGLGLLGGLLWACWPTLSRVIQKWATDPQYSHGYLVPAFALALLWLRRKHLEGASSAFHWWGLLLLLAGLLAHLAGVYLYFDWLAQAALLPCLAGVFAVLGGGKALRWSWPAVGFLAFMFPLPYRLEVALSLPLRHIGTVAATYFMQTVGLPAVAEGNVIIVHDLRIGVEEACSGLSMLVVFFAISTAVALVTRRPVLDKVILLASAAPIAVAANVVRIAVTGTLYLTVGGQAADFFFHDLAGWLMMPLALGLLGLELWFLSRLLVEVEEPAPAQPAPLAKPPVLPRLPKRGGKRGLKTPAK